MATWHDHGVADPKPAKRERNPEAFKRFHAGDWDCLACGSSRVEAHHLISRGQGGDDVLENLVGLCSGCHRAYHGNPYRGAFGRTITPGMVQDAIGRFLCHEAGDDHRAYVLRRLGEDAGSLWMETHFGVEL